MRDLAAVDSGIDASQRTAAVEPRSTLHVGQGGRVFPDRAQNRTGELEPELSPAARCRPSVRFLGPKNGSLSVASAVVVFRPQGDAA